MNRTTVLLAGALALTGCATAVRAPRVSQAYGDLALAKLVIYDDGRGAAADITQAIEFDPRNAQLYLLRGMAYFKQGAKDAADADFRKAIALDSGLKKALRPLLR